MRQPALFISHGSPDLAIRPSEAAAFLREFGKQASKPDAIVIASAHYERAMPMIGSHPTPQTIHDFNGFAPELHAMQYPAPGAPALAGRVVAMMQAAGIAAKTDGAAGLDHGIWTPLVLMFPDGDIPVVPVAVQPEMDAAHHLALGQAVSKLRDENILILGSGHITHNLQMMFHAMRGGQIPPESEAHIEQFTGWIGERLDAGDIDGLQNWETSAPHARENHPTPEHLMPFFFALGAGMADDRAPNARLAHSSKLFGRFNSDFWLFD